MTTRTMCLVAICAALLLTVTATLPVTAGETGDLQVTCWPGYRIYLDGQFAGLTSSDQDGLFLRGVEAGERSVQVEKLGYQAKELRITVPAGGIAELKVGDLLPGSAAPPPVVPAPPQVPAAAPAPVAAPIPATAPEPAPAPASQPILRAEQPAPSATRPEPVAQSVSEPAPAAARPAPAPVAPARDSEAEDLARLIRSRDADRDVMFIYRVRGEALDAHATVSINRERGGPRSPVLAFLCSERYECLGQTSATYPPGRYRYRVTFRSMGRGKNEVLFSHDLYLELEAVSGKTYLIDVNYDSPDRQYCNAEISEVEE